MTEEVKDQVTETPEAAPTQSEPIQIPGLNLVLQESDAHALIGRLVAENSTWVKRYQILAEEYQKVVAKVRDYENQFINEITSAGKK